MILVGTICFLVVALLVLWIWITIWVYNDAEKRGENGALWAILVFLFGLIPLIIWLIIRPSERQVWHYQTHPYSCPYCQRPLTFIYQYNRWYCYTCQRYL